MQERERAFVEVWTHLRRRRLALAAHRVLLGLALGGWFSSLMLDIEFHAAGTAEALFGAGGVAFGLSVLALLAAAFGSESARQVLEGHFEGTRFVSAREAKARGPAPPAGTDFAERTRELDFGAGAAWLDGPGVVATVDASGAIARATFEDERAALALLERSGSGFGRRAALIPLARRNPAVALGGVAFSTVVLFVFAGVIAAGVEDIAHGLDVPKALAMSFCLAVAVGAVVALKRALHGLDGGDVVVGTDGLVVRRDGKVTSIPAARIRAVIQRGGSVFVTPERGEVVSLDVERAATAEQTEERGLALVRLISRGMTSARSRSQPGASELERRGRDAAAWRQDLANVGKGGARYRIGELDRAGLAAVIGDAAETPERRVGAAIALHAIEPRVARASALEARDAAAGEDMKALLEDAAEGEVDERRLDRAMLAHRVS